MPFSVENRFLNGCKTCVEGYIHLPSPLLINDRLFKFSTNMNRYHVIEYSEYQGA